MAQTSRSNIAQFPVRNHHAHGLDHEADFLDEDFNPPSSPVNMHHIFMIDEPDPLLISESQSSEFIPDPALSGPDLKVISGGATKKTGYLRIKDLHPIDLLIALGLLAIGFFF